MVRHYTVSGIVLPDGRVLLIEHRKSGSALPPGGHINPGEDPVQALRREVREEVGIDVEVLAERRFSHPGVGVVAAPFIHDVTVQPAEVGGFCWVPLVGVAAMPTPPEIPALVLAAASYASQF
jgi:8-oxo-dGTP pyrophosphatase MutT (NUDIX family)